MSIPKLEAEIYSRNVVTYVPTYTASHYAR